MLQQPVGLADQLHVAVLDAVVHHLHVVACAARTHPVAAGDVALGPDLGGDRLEDRLHEGPGRLRAARHQARALERALLAAGHARADEEQAGRLDILGAPLGVGIERVAAIDDYVALGEQRRERLDQVVDGGARLHHHHDLAGWLERRDEVFQRVAADDIGLVAARGREGVGDARCSVENGDGIAAAGDVEGQVLAHDGQTDQTDVTRGCFCHRALLLQFLERCGRNADYIDARPAGPQSPSGNRLESETEESRPVWPMQLLQRDESLHEEISGGSSRPARLDQTAQTPIACGCWFSRRRLRSQVAKAADCKSAIVGSTPTGASFFSQSQHPRVLRESWHFRARRLLPAIGARCPHGSRLGAVRPRRSAAADAGSGSLDQPSRKSANSPHT